MNETPLYVVQAVEAMTRNMFVWVPVPKEKPEQEMQEKLLQEVITSGVETIKAAIVLDTVGIVQRYWHTIGGIPWEILPMEAQKQMVSQIEHVIEQAFEAGKR